MIRNSSVASSLPTRSSRNTTEGVRSRPCVGEAVVVEAALLKLARILIVILGVAASVREAAAQPPEEAIDKQVKLYIDPLRQWLPLELQFAEEVCELTEDQVAALRKAAEEEIELIAKHTAAALRRSPQVNQARRVVVVGGRAVAAPAGLDEELLIAPTALTHSIVWRTLQQKWPDAWQRFDAERQRLDERRRQAAILAEVTALDERLLLSNRQRTDLCGWLAKSGADGWRESANVAPIVDPAAEQLQATLAGGSLGAIAFPEAELAKLLLPSQLATFKDSQRPWREEVVLVQRAAQKRADVAAAAAQLAGRDDAAREIEVAKLDAQQDAAVVRRQAVARVKRQVVRRGIPIDEQRRQIARYVERLIDTISTGCALSESQRDKLLVAGKLDIEKLYEQSQADNAPIEAGGNVRIVHQVRIGVGDAALPVKVFGDQKSYFQRALRSQLLDEQKRKLADAARERREFQRRALVEAAVVGFERAAALTSRQCHELSFVMNEALSENEDEPTVKWRAACVSTIARVDDEKLALVLSDLQLPFGKRHQAAIKEAARQFEMQVPKDAAAPLGIGGGGMF
jgi:hypothetical protein